MPAMPIDLERLTAPNPSPMTLEGTNTYVVGREPAVVIDPGPDDAGHIEAVREAAQARGGIGTVLLTHGHGDHTDGVDALGVGPTPVSDGKIDRRPAGAGDPGACRGPLLLPAREGMLHRGPDPGHGLDDRGAP